MRSFKIYGLGAIILGALVACSRITTATVWFVVLLSTAGIAYLFAFREFARVEHFPRRVLVVCLAMAAVWRIAFLITPPGPDDDIHRYVWDGRVQRLGYNPYSVIPGDPAFAAIHTPETRGLNHPGVPSPYPAGAQLFFRGVVAIHESTFAFKIAFLICDLAIVLLLLIELHRDGRREHLVLAYAWHPLLGVNVSGSGHIDIVGVLLLLLSAVALRHRRSMIAAIAFALAVAVKLLPLVLIPVYWRRLRIRDALIAAFVLLLLYAPFLKYGSVPIGSLKTYVQSFRFNGPVFATLERWASPQILAVMAVLVGMVTAGWLTRRRPACWTDGWAWPMAASLACAPVVYPWYLVWLLPFLRSTATLPLVVWTVSILPTYVVWHLRSQGHIWQLPGWIQVLEYGSVVTVAAIVLLRRRFQSLSMQGNGEKVLSASVGRNYVDSE